jgi:hypothetical protein
MMRLVTVYNLIALFAVRNPVLRLAAHRAQRHAARVIGDIIVSSERMYRQHVEQAKEAGFIRPDLEVSYKRMRDFIRRDEYTISIPTVRHVQTEFRVFNQILDKVARRYWSVLSAKPDAPDLITCDGPAPTRLGARNIVFTISPRHALFGAAKACASRKLGCS